MSIWTTPDRARGRGTPARRALIEQGGTSLRARGTATPAEAVPGRRALIGPVPGSVRRGPRALVRAAVAVPAVVSLALPLLALTEIAGLQPAAAAEKPAPCTAPGSSAHHRHVSGGSREAVARAAAARWFPASQLDMATAVAGAESSWLPTAVNRAAGGNYGLWQINSIHSGLLRGRDWSNPRTNAWMAYKVWDAADGVKGNRKGAWTPWSVYSSGSYRDYLDKGARSHVPAKSAKGSNARATEGCVDAGGPGITVGTWNALKSNSTANIAAGTRALTEHADVFGLQELGNERKRAAAARGAEDYTMSTDHTAVPILFSTDKYDLVDEGRELAFPAGQRVEHSDKDGHSVLGPKWVTWVHLRDKATDQEFYVLNTHMVVGAQNSVRIRRANPRRVALYKRQLATVTSLADRFRADGATVYATCDCNVNYAPKVAPVKAMVKHELRPSWETLDSRATHGRRAIDYVWSTAVPASQITGDHHGSDHAFLAVSFLPSDSDAVAAGVQRVAGGQHSVRTRVVSDPTSGRTYEVPIPAGRNGQAISFALDQLGDTWDLGSHGPRQWDCSGLTAGAWAAAGVRITPQSDAQRRELRHVSLRKMRPGDIVWHRGYVGIYLGTVGHERVVVGSVKEQGHVVIHTTDDSDIKAVLRPVK